MFDDITTLFCIELINKMEKKLAANVHAHAFRLVSEKCYPYMSGVTEKKEICYSTCNDECPNKIAKPFTQKMTPMYRIASNERSIQYEIENNGPVQAIIKVRAL